MCQGPETNAPISPLMNAGSIVFGGSWVGEIFSLKNDA
jgi:hypothetical protein